MKIALIAFSPAGGQLAGRLAAALDAGTPRRHQCLLYMVRRHARPGVEEEADACQDSRGLEGQDKACARGGFLPFDSVHDLTAALFDQVDALCYFSASGIAVRAIAPLVRSKLSDPAVLVGDETGRFLISLLSGHAGGANALTAELAPLIGATAVITTASDCHIAGGTVSEEKNLVLGIGCRRGLTAETIERAVTIMLWDQKIALSRVEAMATIDVKKDDAGLVRFAAAHKIDLHFYSAAQLAGVPGAFAASARVRAAVGVDNVCERAAVLLGGAGRLIVNKTARDGVTVAVFARDNVWEN